MRFIPPFTIAKSVTKFMTIPKKPSDNHPWRKSISAKSAAIKKQQQKELNKDSIYGQENKKPDQRHQKT